MSVRRACARWGSRRVLCALAALAALGAAAVRAPVQLDTRAEFPRLHAAALAHLLADFSTHPHASHAWRVEEERGNYSEWRYRVSFECGARCAGSATVLATSGGAVSHGRAPRHTVRATLVACSRLPLLPWPRACDEVEVEWRVRDAAEGCELQEAARAWCPALRVLSGACARDLRLLRDLHLARLRTAAAAAA